VLFNLAEKYNLFPGIITKSEENNALLLIKSGDVKVPFNYTILLN